MNLKHCFITITLFIALHTTVSAQVFTNSDLTITKLEDKLWVVETTDKTTMYIIEGSEKALLIDTGTKCEKLDEIVRNITKKPLLVVLTHIHSDHAGNLDAFADIYYHAADTLLLSMLKPYKGNTHFVKDGDIFDLGDEKIEVKHMPAHTPGSIVLIDRAAGNCFSGDAFGSGQVWLQLWPFSTMETYIQSCKKMEQLMDEGISKIYCGHYPYVKKALDIQYIRNMRILAEAIQNGTVKDPKVFPTRIPGIGGPNPMIATDNGIAIVYEPSKIK
ncbi:MAG: MBL fold metallo-hydrolase [Paludibacter sp.]|nr:MBL fold metallo-hydrolase [Paludibacter sp.]